MDWKVDQHWRLCVSQLRHVTFGVGLLLCVSAAGVCAQTLSETPSTADSSVSPDGSDSEDSISPANLAENATLGETSNWMSEIDDAFGKWVVAPVAAVLFFDFGTKESLGTSVPFVVLWLLLGASFFTLRMGLINVRGFWHAIRLTKGDYDDPNDVGEVSHFQALASALSATVGLGNIAGVAIAIGTGGPGATFWMIVVGFLGMSSKFAECTLGQMYRKVNDDGTVSGGAMHYLRDGLADLGLKPLGSILAFVFAVLCIGASFGGGNAFQIGQSLDAIRGDIPLFDNYPWVYGLLMACLAGIVIIGGIKSIGAVASKIVPFMCVAYVLMALFILGTNLDKIRGALESIFAGALSLEAGFGGFLGVMVIGIQRAVFSNEAGIGSAAIAHSAAKTDEPVSEGIVALLEPFIDTVVICTMTALVIIITGAVEANPELVAGENKSGAALTVAAVSGEYGIEWFKYVLFAAVVLFAYSTLVSWSYYGERCWISIFGASASIYYKILFLAFTVLGSIVTTGNILDFSDLLILGMALPNIFGVALLSGRVKRALDTYWQKHQAGELGPPQKF
ncbi:MAG: alanine:cation symporter family protein [Pirellulaceae bacterium]|nr:alanine:cation symporter family protein [Pirellulaceae bacterium]